MTIRRVLKASLNLVSLLPVAVSAVAAPLAMPTELERAARDWAESFFFGYNQGKYPPSKVLCAIESEEGLRSELGYLRYPPPKAYTYKYANTTQVQGVGDVIRLIFILDYGDRKQEGLLDLQKVGPSFCIRDAMTQYRAAALKEEMLKKRREQQAGEIFDQK